MWGATLTDTIKNLDKIISIHAPRVGSDSMRPTSAGHYRHFNPRSPCGERPAGKIDTINNICISIHAPRVGSDLERAQADLEAGKFQSTLPVWGATVL